MDHFFLLFAALKTNRLARGEYKLVYLAHPKGVVNLNKALGDNRNCNKTAFVISEPQEAIKQQ